MLLNLGSFPLPAFRVEDQDRGEIPLHKNGVSKAALLFQPPPANDVKTRAPPLPF